MSAEGIRYIRLTGRGRRWVFLSYSLWLGPDHILGVQTLGVNEDYKRFYFRDIQSITIEQNRTALLWNCVNGALATVIGALFYAFSASAGPGGGTGYLITGGILSGIFLLALIISYLRGPSCVCRLKTAVQTEELPSLARTHAAQKTLAIIKPLIEQAQGAFSPEEFANLAASGIPAPPVRPAPQPAALAAAASAAVIKRPSTGKWHAALFSALIVDSVCGFLSLLHPTWRALESINMVLTLLVLGLCFTALIRQRSATLPDNLKRITIAAFVLDITSMFIGVIYGYIFRVNYTLQHMGREPAHVALNSMWGFSKIDIFFNTLELLVGVAGLILAVKYILSLRQPATEDLTPPAPLA